MTEKRFVPIFDGFDKRVVGAKDNGVIISFMDMFDLLNGLNDENGVLKQQLKSKYIVNKQYEELQKVKEENEQLKKENRELKSILQDIGLIMTNEEVKNVRDKISSKLIKPLCEGNGFDVDVNTENGFTIIPKGVNNDRE